MSDNSLRVMVVGAHPDDPDVSAGGSIALWTRAGCRVRMVSLTKGDAGHHVLAREALAERRRQEAAAAGRVLGAEYVVLDHPDGALVADLNLRLEVIRLVRGFAPDLVLTPRVWDYHPDHRATAQVVQDASYLLTVPLVASDTPHLRQMPVIGLVWDGFTRPVPFAPDVVVDTDPVLVQKLDAAACHASQVYEWLPYNRGALGQVPATEAARRSWLAQVYAPRFRAPAEAFRSQLVARYGAQRGSACGSAEAFELSEYGRQPSPQELRALFPF